MLRYNIGPGSKANGDDLISSLNSIQHELEGGTVKHINVLLEHNLVGYLGDGIKNKTKTNLVFKYSKILSLTLRLCDEDETLIRESKSKKVDQTKSYSFVTML